MFLYDVYFFALYYLVFQYILKDTHRRRMIHVANVVLSHVLFRLLTHPAFCKAPSLKPLGLPPGGAKHEACLPVYIHPN